MILLRPLILLRHTDSRASQAHTRHTRGTSTPVVLRENSIPPPNANRTHQSARFFLLAIRVVLRYAKRAQIGTHHPPFTRTAAPSAPAKLPAQKADFFIRCYARLP